MLAGVVEIDNLNGVGKMQGHKIPNPFGAVADHDLLECAAPAASPGFPIDSTTKLFRTLDGSGVGGGIGIADWIAFLIPRRLGEHASQLGFPSMGRLTFGLALPTDRLFLHHRNSRPIHLHVQDANRLARHHWPFQLQGFLNLVLFAVTHSGSRGPRLVQSGSQGRFHGFQIGPTVLMALCKNKAEESVYFSRHFLMDRSSVFFSCSVQPPRCCSTGRSRQIFSLRATRSWLSFWKR